MRGTIRARIRMERIDRNMIAAYMIQARIPRAQGRRRVDLHLTLGPRNKEGDVDAYWKGLLDGLVACGMLIDDRRQYCQLGDVTYERGAQKGAVIILTDV
ncbi:MAG: RusA family crossover junction endodeoxyribonuclease [Candidatus Limnocylindrales bacterium]